MGRNVDAEKVAWFAPETLRQQALAEQLATETDPEKIRELLIAAPTDGQYRYVSGEEVVDGPQGTTVIAPSFGSLVQWVDDTPDDREDNTGHFELYTGDEAEYRAIVQKGK